MLEVCKCLHKKVDFFLAAVALQRFFIVLYEMEFIITTKEDLEALVQTSVNKALAEFFAEKERKARTKDYLSVKETAALFDVSQLTIRNYISRGYLKAEKFGHQIRIKKIEIDNALKEVKSLKYKR